MATVISGIDLDNMRQKYLGGKSVKDILKEHTITESMLRCYIYRWSLEICQDRLLPTLRKTKKLSEVKDTLEALRIIYFLLGNR